MNFDRRRIEPPNEQAPASHDTVPPASRERLQGMSVTALETMFLSFPNAVIHTSADRKILACNPAAENLFGYSAQELIGQSVKMVYADESEFAEQGVLRYTQSAPLEQISYQIRYRRKNGEVFWSETTGRSIRDRNGHAIGFLGIIRDITEQRRYEERLGVLANATAALAASLEPEQILSNVADTVVPMLADFCTIDLVDDDTTIRRLGVAHPNPEIREVARSWWKRFKLDVNHWIHALVRMRKSPGVIHVTDELVANVATPEMRNLLHEMRIRQIITVPVGTHERAFGALSIAMADSGRSFSQVDADMATELGTRIGVAIENARLFRAEKETRNRVTKLQQLTAALASAGTLVEVASATCQLGAEATGAKFVSAWILSEDRILDLAATFKYPASSVDAWKRLVLDSEPNLHAIIEGGVAAFYESEDEIAKLGELALAEARLTGIKASVAVPIRAGTKTVGLLSFSYPDSKRFDAQDRSFFETIAGHCGQAMERARLLEAEKRSTDHLALLARAGEAFSASMDYETTLRNVVQVALPTLGDFGFFDVVEGDHVRRVPASYQDEETLALLETTQWVRSERTDKNLCALSSGRPAIHSMIDDAWMQDVAVAPAHLDLLRKLQLCSLVTVPLYSRGDLVGALTLCFGKSGRRYTVEDLRLAEELARRGSVAVGQARLFHEAQEAARHAEEAVRIKDEFLATVSHELRTPLNAIVGWATILRGDRELAPSAQKGIDVIHRNAQAQVRLVEDILDVSGIITGKFKIDPKPIDMVTVVRQAIDVVRASAAAKSIRLIFEPGPHPALLVADPDRIQQVIWNLLSNAVKFTDSNGFVRIEVAQNGPAVTVKVVDNGQGIDPAFLPFVFERFRQADSSTKRSYGGLGLGLAIVRHIVELHGGRAEAHSEGFKQGAAFTVTFPVRAVASTSAEGSTHAISAEPQSDQQELDLARLRVLVVDDEPDARELIQLVLTDADAEVEVAGSVGEAIVAVRRFRPEVLISDLGMPGDDGFELIRQVRLLGDDGRMAAIALTAYTRAEDRRKAIAAGFTTHLSKPVAPEDLLATVASLASLSMRARR